MAKDVAAPCRPLKGADAAANRRDARGKGRSSDDTLWWSDGPSTKVGEQLDEVPKQAAALVDNTATEVSGADAAGSTAHFFFIGDDEDDDDDEESDLDTLLSKVVAHQ